MRLNLPALAGLLLRLTLGLTLLLGPFNRSFEHEVLHQVAEDTWAPLGLVGGAEVAFAIADVLEFGLGAALLLGIFTRWVALAAAGLFGAFISSIGLTELNRDMGLLAAALALALLGSSSWSLDQLLQGRLGRLARTDEKLTAWVRARLPLPAPALASLTLRLGLSFTLLANGVLLLRGVASFGSPIFEHPEPAPGLGLVELGLGLALLAGWQTRWVGVGTALYLGASLAWMGFGTQMRSLPLAGAALVLALLGPGPLDWERLVELWEGGWEALPRLSRAGLGAVFLAALLALGPAAAYTARDLDQHQIYFETHGRTGPSVSDGVDEGQSRAAEFEVGEYNLTYVTLSLQVDDNVGADDTLKVTVRGPQGQQQEQSTSDSLELIFTLGHMPPVEQVSEEHGSSYMHENGTGVWEVEVECEEAPGTTFLGQDTGNDGECDWTWQYELEFFESHIVEHSH